MKGRCSTVIPGIAMGALILGLSPVAAQQFTNITESAGVDDVHEAEPVGPNCVFDMTFIMNSGCAFGDFDNDSYMDLYLADGGGHSNVLYRNNGNDTFADVTRGAGVGDLSRSMGVGFGDINSDGWQDIYVANLGQPNRLYLSERDGTFTDISVQAGVDFDGFNTSFVFDDFNKDGWLDIYVITYGPMCDTFPQGSHSGSPNVLYVNNGDGMTFTDMTGPASAGGGTTWSLAVTSADVDNDGDQDIYVADDWSGGNALLINEFIERGRLEFTDKSDDYGVRITGNMMSSMFGDIDNDGDFDLYSSNYHIARPRNSDRFNGNALFRNEFPDETFTDISLESGTNPGHWGWGSVFVDVDLDGWLDIFEVNGWPFLGAADTYFGQANLLFRNVDGIRFEEIGPSLGIDRPWTSEGVRLLDSRGLAKADIDNDGDEDVYIRNNQQSGVLFRNDYAGPNHWLQVEALGTSSNRFAIGARFWVSAGGTTRTGYVTGGDSYLSQSSPIVTFGLGEATAVDSLVVLWPAGGREVFFDLQVDRRYRVVESSGIETSVTSELDNSDENRAAENSSVEVQSIPQGIRVTNSGEPGSFLDVSVYNLLGQRIYRSSGGAFSASTQETVWYGTDEYGRQVGSGVYFVRVSTDTKVSTSKVLLLR